MSFALFVVYLLVVFVRPAERFAELREWPLFEIASILALAGAAVAVLMGSRPALRAVPRAENASKTDASHADGAYAGPCSPDDAS